MIKPITMYETSDGARFDTSDLAAAREKLLADIIVAMQPLGTTRAEVEDGKGWVHHNIQNVLKTKRALLKLAAPCLRSFPWYVESKFDDIHPMSIAGRIIDESGGPLATAWSRLNRIDSEGREFQQPYFAVHGPGPDQSCIEDRR